MDNEVSICCFYAVIRNCHTPFHSFISLGLFACWNFLWSRMESVILANWHPAEMRSSGSWACSPPLRQEGSQRQVVSRHRGQRSCERCSCPGRLSHGTSSRLGRRLTKPSNGSSWNTLLP